VTITTENGGFVDPNSLAVYLCISFIFCVDRLLNELGKLRRILILISTTLIILAILFTGSRGGMLSLLVAISCFVLTYIFQWEIRRKNIVNLFYILLTIVIFLIVSNTLLPKELIERFSFSNWTSDGGSDRTLIWKLTIENLLEKYLLLGSGVGTFPYVFEYHVGWFKVAHNTWLELLIEKGIIGLSLWITLIILLFKKAIKNKESTIIVLLISIIVAETFLSAEVSKHWWNTLMLSMLYTKEIYHKKIS
ncbi:O-antigen ligase family protein, partial [Peribacillus butanolivorans]